MTGLLFAHPDSISPLALGLIAVAAALLWAGARSRRRMQVLLGDGAVHVAAALRRGSLRDGVAFVALLLIAVAFVGPRIGERTIQLSTSGIDLVILLDASRSMDASDTPPSRIDAAHRAVRTILGGLGARDQAVFMATTPTSFARPFASRRGSPGCSETKSMLLVSLSMKLGSSPKL